MSKRLKDRVREIVVGNASRNLDKTIAVLNPVLRGQMSYFRLTEIKRGQKLDGWIRRKLRCLHYGGNGRDRLPATSDYKREAWMRSEHGNRQATDAALGGAPARAK